MLVLSAEEHQEHHVHKQHKRREGKRPDLQRYHPVPGHGRCHRDSEEGDTGPSEDPVPLASDSHDPDQTSKSKDDNKSVSDTVLERHGRTDGGMSTNKRDEDRMRGDGSNTQNCRKDTHPHAKTEVNQDKDFAENDREHQEASGAAKPTKKARKPDREFYQPGSRRSIQGKDCGVGREQDKPPSRKLDQKIDPESQCSIEERERKQKSCIQKQGGKDKDVKGIQENLKLAKSSETNKRQGCKDVDKPPLPLDATVEKLTSKVEKLSVKEKGKVGAEGHSGEEASCRRVETTDKGRRGQGGGTKEGEEKVEKKREKGNRRRRGGEREKERNQDSRRGEDEVSVGGKSDRVKAEKERDRRAAEADRDNKPGKTGETHQSKGRENRRERESRRGDNNNNRSRDADKDAKTERNVDRAVERSDRNKSNANITTPTSKRYSKSDIRRSRNRTYSSSSASSVTSLDGPGLGMNAEGSKWSRLEPRHNNREGMANSGEGRRSHLQSWTTNGESSTESLEGSEMSDIAEDRRRRRRGGEEELSAERRREERNRSKGNKGGGRGILRVSLEKPAVPSSHSGDVQHRKQGLVPRGRGGGILVLPARTDISNSPEIGQRLFGGIRGGAACRSRGGRGGGVRRLWDPNNPDQKPALTRSQSSQHSSLQQPIYLQSGAGYGQLHFLDTDDEISGSPPVPQGEHFRSQQQQAAAMAYYKFQKSDNPYCYPMATSNPHNPSATTTQRYPYTYHMGPYQMAPPNGVYPGAAVSQFCGSYRGAGYSQPGAGGGLPFEEVEQQARGELGRVLRAADAQELQLSNLLSRDRVSADGLDRMAQLR